VTDKTTTDCGSGRITYAQANERWPQHPKKIAVYVTRNGVVTGALVDMDRLGELMRRAATEFADECPTGS
jgi:hypothetical protein